MQRKFYIDQLSQPDIIQKDLKKEKRNSSEEQENSLKPKLALKKSDQKEKDLHNLPSKISWSILKRTREEPRQTNQTTGKIMTMH